jgi:hypothetical protein
VGTKGSGKISKSIYKTVRGSHKSCIGHTKGGEVRIKRTVGLSGRIGCSCVSSVILLMVACGSGDHASHGHVSSVVVIGECAFGRTCMSEWGACGRVCCRDVVSLCGQAYTV